METDRRFMVRAIELARRGLGTTAPNPSVGAVVVRDGVVLGEGTTRPAGHDHAEVVAIHSVRAQGRDPVGATMYVTLEPCCHHGRTPPCTDAIIDAGITRVVVGCQDAFPAMQGRGLAALRHAGIDVRVGVEGEACERLVVGFTRAITHGLPEVSCKAAISLDGNIATATGESQWITGPEARTHGHGLRATHDAILVGIGTVLADDPRLTCRIQQDRDPIPVILDTELRISEEAAVFSHPREPWIVCAEDAPVRSLRGRVLRVPRSDAGVDVEVALRALAAEGAHRILVEGGGRVHRSLLDRSLVDTLYLYVAGLVVPGGQSWLGGPPLESLGDAVRCSLVDTESLGGDVLLRYTLSHLTEET